MIRLSKLADYAFVILTQMVSSDRGAWAAADLALKTTLPGPTVAKIMKLLAKGGIVASSRGATGGYHLTAPATEITIARIIEAVDGPIALTACVDAAEPDCAVQTLCPMHGGWDKINRAVRGALTEVTLADLAGSIVQPPACAMAKELDVVS